MNGAPNFVAIRWSVGLGPLDGEADLEAGGAWLGFDGDGSVVFGDDAVDGVQTEAQTLARRLGGVERLEDA